MRVLIASVFALACAPAHAEFLNGEALFSMMKSEQETPRHLARAYIAGVHDAQRGVSHCSAEGLSLSDLSAAVQSMLSEAQSLRVLPADVLIGKMLETAFPCSDEKKSPSSGHDANPRRLGSQT